MIRDAPMDELEPTNKQRIGPVLWREKWVILASVVVMLALAVVYVVTASKTYEAKAILQVNVTNSNPGSSDTTNTNQALAQNYAALLTSAGFLNQIRPTVEGGQLSVDELQGRISATAPQMSALVNLNVTGPSPGEAQTVAQQVITGFLATLQRQATTRTTRLESQLQRQIAQLSTQISNLGAQPPSATTTEQINSLKASRQALISQNATLVANGLAQGTSATESAAPVASSSPISPKKSLALIAGLLLGLLLGVILAWLRQRLRPAIHSSEEATRLVDVPLLASIPLKPRPSSDDPTLAEAYGVLYANLMFGLRGSGMRVVTCVGFNPQVGKTSTVEGIGRAAARAGDRRVLIVDGDMRMATLSARFGHRDHPGIVDVLQGIGTLDDALVAVADGLWLLPARPSRVNAGSLLSGSRTAGLMGDLRERFDLVLIDSPPISGLADGLILASHSDTVAIVARSGLTKPADLTSATSSLQQIRTPIAGIVVFEDVSTERYYGPTESESQPRPEPVAP